MSQELTSNMLEGLKRLSLGSGHVRYTTGYATGKALIVRGLAKVVNYVPGGYTITITEKGRKLLKQIITC